MKTIINFMTICTMIMLVVFAVLTYAQLTMSKEILSRLEMKENTK